MPIFSCIFFSNYWWQKSDIWSQASYRYPISWKLFWTHQIPTSCLSKSGGIIRDQPFNLKVGLWFFVSFRNFFSDNTRVRIFFILSGKARIFFPGFNIRLYDKNSESDYFVFPPPKSEYFFQQHWESEYFFRKKTITPPSS